MVVSFLDGTKVVEDGVYDAIRKCLHQLIKSENTVTFYFSIHSDFILQCEWLARTIQAAFPTKNIERVAVISPDNCLGLSRCQFDRCELIDCQKGPSLWRWMVDHSDYAITYIHPPLCTSRDRMAVWNYARKSLKENCLNFATEDAWQHICTLIPTLSKRERTVFEMKLRGENQPAISQAVGRSGTIAHGYLVGARCHLERAAYTPMPLHRTCAVLGFLADTMSEADRSLLLDAISYLVYNCQVTTFIVQKKAFDPNTSLMHILKSLCILLTRKTQVTTVPEPDDQSFSAINHSTGRINRGLEERKAMIDRADIVLCSVQHTYGSGLRYAAEKHIPVINLADLSEQSKEYSNGT